MKLKNKHIFFSVIILGMIFSLTACKKEDARDINKDEVNIKESKFYEDNIEITKLLPEKENYKWIYSGFAEYGHKMILTDIEKNEKIKKPEDIMFTYKIEGEVDDVSGGEAKGDFSLDIRYEIGKGEMKQIKKEEHMLDSKFDEITIIKTPLEKGNSWTEKKTDSEGREYNIKASIEDIIEKDNRKIYVVKYEDTNSKYYERRKIEEGIGIIAFETVYITEDGMFDIGYSIYREESGYLENKED